MKIIKSMILAAAAMTVCGCAEKIDRNVTWPEWASRPIIENPTVSAGGKTEITAGETVSFTARIHDDYNELKSWGISVKYGDNVVFSKETEVTGHEAEIEYEFVMPFAANLDEGGFWPEVTVSSKNVAGGEYSTRISRDRNVSVNRPAAPAELFVIDENGASFAMGRTAGSLAYATEEGADLTKLGQKVFIAEKVSGGKPDFSGFVWGMSEEGKIALVKEGGKAISVPDSEGYGFRKFGFDTYGFCINKLVNLTISLDKTTMESVSQSGVNYLAKEKVHLVQDCEVTFSGFGELKSMLQSDRFEILSDTAAKFTGHSADWSFWFDTETGWMILNYAVFNTSGQVWITGLKACFPLGNDDSTHDLKYLDGDGKVRYATLAAVKDADGDFSILVYLKDDYTIQPFRWVKWSTTVEMTSMTPETASITDGIFIRPGSTFKPGIYRIRLHFTREPDKNGDGSKAEVYVTAL